MSDARFEVVRVKSKPDEYPPVEGAYVRLVAANGETLFHTEVFDSLSNGKRAVEDIVRTVGAVVENHHRTGEPLFKVKRPRS